MSLLALAFGPVRLVLGLLVNHPGAGALVATVASLLVVGPGNSSYRT